MADLTRTTAGRLGADSFTRTLGTTTARSSAGGTDTLYTSSAAAALNGASVTMALWAKRRSAAANSQYGELLTIGGYNSGQGGMYLMVPVDTTAIQLVIDTNGTTGITASGNYVLPADQWVCLVVTSTGTTNILYANGVQVASVNATRYQAAATVKVCRSGKFDFSHIAIWNSVLSASDIATLGSTTDWSGVAAASLQRYWPIDGTSSPEPDSCSVEGLAVTGTSSATGPANCMGLGSDWTIDAGSWGVVSNWGRHNGSLTDARARYTTLGTRASVAIQASAKFSDGTGGSPTIAVLNASNAGYLLSGMNTTTCQRWKRSGAGSYATIGSGYSITTGNGTARRLTAYAANSVQRGWIDANDLGALTDASYTGPWYVGLRSYCTAGVVEFDYVVVCSDSRITFTSIPTGYGVRLQGTTATTEISGTVTLEWGAYEWGVDRIFEVVNGGGTVVLTETLSAVDGGDSYQYSSTNSPPTAPGAFTTPAADTYDTSVSYSHGTATDPDGGSLQYEVRRWNGASETVVRTLGASTSDTLDTTAWANGTYTLRAYAHDGTDYSTTYATSATITILHPTVGQVNQVIAEALVSAPGVVVNQVFAEALVVTPPTVGTVYQIIGEALTAGSSAHVNQIFAEALIPLWDTAEARLLQMVAEALLPAKFTTQPLLSAVAVSAHEIAVTITPGVRATDHALYYSDTASVPIDADHLWADSLGASPAVQNVTGLVGGTYYYFVCVASNTWSTANSPEISCETLGEGTAPELRLGTVAEYTADLYTNEAAAILEVRYETATAANTDWSPLVQDFSDTTAATMFGHTVTGLSNTTAYIARARFRRAGGWSDWSNIVAWTTSAEVAEPALYGGGILRPHFGEVVAGNCEIAWPPWGDEAGTVTIRISDDLGTTWSVLVAATLEGDGTYTFDTTAYDDGIDYCLKVERDLDPSDYYLLSALKIDNAASDDNHFWMSEPWYRTWQVKASERALDPVGASDLTSWGDSRAWAYSTYYCTWASPPGSCVGAAVVKDWGYARYFDVTVDGFLFGKEGGYGGYWARYYDQEHARIGPGLATSQGTTEGALVLGIESIQLSPYGTCLSKGIGDAQAGAEFTALYGTTGGSPNSIEPSSPWNLALGSRAFEAMVRQSDTYLSCGTLPLGRESVYRVRVRLDQVAGDTSKCWLRMHVEGPRQTHPVGADYWIWQHQLSIIPSCGHAGFGRWHQANQGIGNDGGRSAYFSLGVSVLPDALTPCVPVIVPLGSYPKLILPLPPKWYDPEDERQTRFLVGQALLQRGSGIPLPTPGRGYDRVNEAAFRLAVAQALPDVDLSPFANPAASYDQHSEGDLRHRLEQIL